jgi:hypothetical protein
LAPVIGSVAAANGAIHQSVSGDAGIVRPPPRASERSWIG